MHIDMSPRPEVAEDAAEGGPWAQVFADEPKPTPAELAAQHRGQTRVAYLLADRYADRLMHVHGLGWHIWDGTRWALDPGDKDAKNAVHDTTRAQWGNAFGDRELTRDLQACQNAAAVNGVLDLASAIPELSASVAELDADPYRLNCSNGTLDLRTMQLEPHNPRDRITRVAGAAYRPGTRSEVWERTLARVLPDEAVRGYLQRFTGLALVGKVIEHVFTVAYGPGGRNGKGTFYETLLHALGDYGHTAPATLFMSGRREADAATPALMALRGARFVAASETEQEHQLAVALVKNLTGGDPINARALHRDPIMFEPSHTVLLVTNYLPRLKGDDPALWRRMRVVPFMVCIPEHGEPGGEDTGLKDTLKLHIDAVLAWAVAGWQDYQRRGGLDEPAPVLAATKEYRESYDGVGRFLEERCLPNPHMSTPFAELWEAWETWRHKAGFEALTQRAFGEELDKRGHRSTQQKRNGRVAKVRTGITLLFDDDGTGESS